MLLGSFATRWLKKALQQVSDGELQAATSMPFFPGWAVEMGFEATRMWKNLSFIQLYKNIVWLVVWNSFIFPYIGNLIIPTDYYFLEGLKPPTS